MRQKRSPRGDTRVDGVQDTRKAAGGSVLDSEFGDNAGEQVDWNAGEQVDWNAVDVLHDA